jgi:hypothetical protein
MGRRTLNDEDKIGIGWKIERRGKCHRTGFERAEKTVSQCGRFLLATLFCSVTALGQG